MKNFMNSQFIVSPRILNSDQGYLITSPNQTVTIPSTYQNNYPNTTQVLQNKNNFVTGMQENNNLQPNQPITINLRSANNL